MAHHISRIYLGSIQARIAASATEDSLGGHSGELHRSHARATHVAKAALHSDAGARSALTQHAGRHRARAGWSGGDVSRGAQRLRAHTVPARAPPGSDSARGARRRMRAGSVRCGGRRGARAAQGADELVGRGRVVGHAAAARVRPARAGVARDHSLPVVVARAALAGNHPILRAACRRAGPWSGLGIGSPHATLAGGPPGRRRRPAARSARVERAQGGPATPRARRPGAGCAAAAARSRAPVGASDPSLLACRGRGARRRGATARPRQRQSRAA